jgi:hypothetical protein
MNSLPKTMDDLVQIALSMQFSDPDAIGKPYQPDGEKDSFVIQGSASASGPFYDVILGKPSDDKFDSVLVLRVRTHTWARSSFTFFRLGASTKWVFGSEIALQGVPQNRFCPDELNSFFNWSFRLYYTQCCDDNLIPFVFTEGAKDQGDAPKLIDSNLGADWQAARENQEAIAREEEEKARAEEEERLRRIAIRAAEEERLHRIAIRAAEVERIRLADEARRIADEAQRKKREGEEKAKAQQAKIIAAKTWFKNTLRTNNFAKEGTFAAQFYRLNDKDVSQFDIFMKDSDIGQVNLANWWNEYKAVPNF